MDEHVVDVRMVEAPRLELFCRKPHDPFVVEEDLQRIAARYEDVEPDIELEVVNEKRVFHVFLYDNPFVHSRRVLSSHKNVIDVVS
jgi:hypothetical protein